MRRLLALSNGDLNEKEQALGLSSAVICLCLFPFRTVSMVGSVKLQSPTVICWAFNIEVVQTIPSRTHISIDELRLISWIEKLIVLKILVENDFIILHWLITVAINISLWIFNWLLPSSINMPINRAFVSFSAITGWYLFWTLKSADSRSPRL